MKELRDKFAPMKEHEVRVIINDVEQITVSYTKNDPEFFHLLTMIKTNPIRCDKDED